MSFENTDITGFCKTILVECVNVLCLWHSLFLCHKDVDCTIVRKIIINIFFMVCICFVKYLEVS